MAFLRQVRGLEVEIDGFFDTISNGALVYKLGIESYLDGSMDDFEQRIVEIDHLEAEADRLSREVESKLYKHSLIPENRGDVLGLLENTDTIIDSIKRSMLLFSIERPEVPSELSSEFGKLGASSADSADELIQAGRAFFRDISAVNDHLNKVKFYEKEADRIGESLRRRIFSSDRDLADKIHLRTLVIYIERVSDAAEDVARRLAIYTIKRMA